MLSHRKGARNLGVAEAFSFELKIRDELVILTANVSGEIYIDNLSTLSAKTQDFLNKLQHFAAEAMREAKGKGIPVALQILQKKITPEVLHAQAQHLLLPKRDYNSYWLTLGRTLPRSVAEFASATNIGMRTLASLLLIAILASERWALGASFGISVLAVLIHVLRNPISKKVLGGNVDRGRSLQNFVATTSLAISSFTNVLTLGQIFLKRILELAEQSKNQQAQTIGVSIALAFGALAAIFALLTPGIKAVAPRLSASLNDESAILKPGSERLQALYAEAKEGQSLLACGKTKASTAVVAPLVPAPDLIAVTARLGGAWVVSQQIALAVKVDESVWSSLLVPLAALSLLFAYLGRGVEIKAGARVLLRAPALSQTQPSISAALKYFSEMASVVYLLMLTPMVASFFVLQRVLRAFDMGMSTGAPFGAVDAVALIVAALLSAASLMLNLVGRGLGFDAHASVGRRETQAYLRRVIEHAHMLTLERNLRPWILALVANAEQVPVTPGVFSGVNPLIVGRAKPLDETSVATAVGTGLPKARPSLVAGAGMASSARVVERDEGFVQAFRPTSVRGSSRRNPLSAAKPHEPAVSIAVAKSAVVVEPVSAPITAKPPVAKIVEAFFDMLADTRYVRHSVLGGVIDQHHAILLFQQMLDLQELVAGLTEAAFVEDHLEKLRAEYAELKTLQEHLRLEVKKLLIADAALTPLLLVMYLALGALTLLLQNLDAFFWGATHVLARANPFARATEDAKILSFLSAARDYLGALATPDLLSRFDNLAQVKAVLLGGDPGADRAGSCLGSIASQAERLEKKLSVPMQASVLGFCAYMAVAGGVAAFMGVNAPSSLNPAEQRTVGEPEINNIFAVAEPTPSRTMTATVTASPTGAPTSSVIPTTSVMASDTANPAPSVTAMQTMTPAVTVTSAASVSATRTPSLSPTGIATAAQTASLPATGSESVTQSGSLISTGSATKTVTSSLSADVTSSPSLSGTDTGSGSLTGSSTALATPTVSPSLTAAASGSRTETGSGTNTRTATGTALVTPSETASSSAASTSSRTATLSGTASRTRTPTTTSLASASVSVSRAPSASGTRTSTLSGSKTASVTPTSPVTPTRSATVTPSATSNSLTSCGNIARLGTSSIICATPCPGMSQIMSYDPDNVPSGVSISVGPQSGAVGYLCTPVGNPVVTCVVADSFDTLQVFNSAKFTAGTEIWVNVTYFGCDMRVKASVAAARRLAAAEWGQRPYVVPTPTGLSALVPAAMPTSAGLKGAVLSSDASVPAHVVGGAVTLGLLVLACCGKRLRQRPHKLRAQAKAPEADSSWVSWLYDSVAAGANLVVGSLFSK